MSDLTKAIERIDGAQLGGESLDDEPEYRAVELVTNAARLVANPNLREQFYLILADYVENVEDRNIWQVVDSLQAALTPGDDE